MTPTASCCRDLLLVGIDSPCRTVPNLENTQLNEHVDGQIKLPWRPSSYELSFRLLPNRESTTLQLNTTPVPLPIQASIDGKESVREVSHEKAEEEDLEETWPQRARFASHRVAWCRPLLGFGAANCFVGAGRAEAMDGGRWQ